MLRCPRCGEMKLHEDNRFNALSRKDNKTHICSDCGFAEAIEALIKAKELEPKFKLGQLVWTRGVNDKVADDEKFAKFVTDSLKRHAKGDWGDMCQEDKAENELALGKYLRIFSAYEAEGLPKIWIITEADRSATTILFPEEY